MFRQLLSCTALCTLGLAALPAAAQVTINGGGAASQTFVYSAPDVNGAAVSELSLYNAGQTAVSFGTYWATVSGAAQAAVLTDDLSCLVDKVTGAHSSNCAGNPIGGVETTHYGVSETVFNTTQLATWATSSVGQLAAGNLIQIPALGTGQAIVINDPGVTSNGQAVLTDNDLCGIFSGAITNFNQITDGPTVPSGVFNLLYRSDAAGNTFSLTNHLSAVCNSSNSAPGVTFTATTTFATLFPAGIATALPNAVGVSGLSTLANTLAGLKTVAYPQAISYISPDWTSVDSATSSAKLSNGAASPLLVAAVKNGKIAYLPITSSIKIALTHIEKGENTTPPTSAAAGANPALWIPIIQQASAGYPIVSYSMIDVPQCYASTTVTAGILGFLKDHYANASYTTIQSNNGLVPVANGAGAQFLAAIRKNILANGNGWKTDIGDKTACKGLVGR